MTSNPKQKITIPTPADLQNLDKQRAVCTHYLADEKSKANYDKGSAGKLGLLRSLLAANMFSKHQTYELQCMGIIFGDVLVAELGMKWVMVEDEYGRDPAIQLPSTSIILFPLTMISKRVQSGKTVDVFDLFNGLSSEVEKAKSLLNGNSS